MLFQNDTDLISQTTSGETLPQLTEVLPKGKGRKKENWKNHVKPVTFYDDWPVVDSRFYPLTLSWKITKHQQFWMWCLLRSVPGITSTALRDHRKNCFLQSNPKLQSATSAIASVLRKRQELLKKREQREIIDNQNNTTSHPQTHQTETTLIIITDKSWKLWFNKYCNFYLFVWWHFNRIIRIFL